MPKALIFLYVICGWLISDIIFPGLFLFPASWFIYIVLISLIMHQGLSRTSIFFSILATLLYELIHGMYIGMTALSLLIVIMTIYVLQKRFTLSPVDQANSFYQYAAYSGLGMLLLLVFQISYLALQRLLYQSGILIPRIFTGFQIYVSVSFYLLFWIYNRRRKI